MKELKKFALIPLMIGILAFLIQALDQGRTAVWIHYREPQGGL